MSTADVIRASIHALEREYENALCRNACNVAFRLNSIIEELKLELKKMEKDQTHDACHRSLR